MSVKIFEILIFAGVTIFLLNKLLTILGTTDEEDQRVSRNQSFFGEDDSIIDVTGTGQAKNTPTELQLSEEAKLRMKLQDIGKLINGFSPEHFISGARTAFKMIVRACEKKDDKTLKQLIDRRFNEDFTSFIDKFGKLNEKQDLLT